MPYTYSHPNRTEHLEARIKEMRTTIFRLQKRLNIAEDGWQHSETALHELIKIIKNLDFTNQNAAPFLQHQLNNLFSSYRDGNSTDIDDETDVDDESGDDRNNDIEIDDDRNNHIEICVESGGESGGESDDESDDNYDSMPELIDDNYCYDENGVRHFAPHLNQWITAPSPGS